VSFQKRELEILHEKERPREGGVTFKNSISPMKADLKDESQTA